MGTFGGPALRMFYGRSIRRGGGVEAQLIPSTAWDLQGKMPTSDSWWARIRSAQGRRDSARTQTREGNRRRHGALCGTTPRRVKARQLGGGGAFCPQGRKRPRAFLRCVWGAIGHSVEWQAGVGMFGDMLRPIDSWRASGRSAVLQPTLESLWLQCGTCGDISRSLVLRWSQFHSALVNDDVIELLAVFAT